MFNFTKVKKEQELFDREVLPDAKESYNEILNLTDIWLKSGSKNEKISLLDYLINTILEDICTSHIAQLLYHKEPPADMKNFIPDYFFDEIGNEISIYTNKNIEVDLSKTRIYVCPWHKTRLHDSLLNLYKNPFNYDKSNHFSYFYTDFNLCYVYNGNHSIHAGIYYKKGMIVSKVCKTELLYPHCKTDGRFWYNLHTGEKLMPVYDFRFAAVFSIAQIRNKIRSE